MNARFVKRDTIMYQNLLKKYFGCSINVLENTGSPFIHDLFIIIEAPGYDLHFLSLTVIISSLVDEHRYMHLVMVRPFGYLRPRE